MYSTRDVIKQMKERDKAVSKGINNVHEKIQARVGSIKEMPVETLALNIEQEETRDEEPEKPIETIADKRAKEFYKRQLERGC